MLQYNCCKTMHKGKIFENCNKGNTDLSYKKTMPNTRKQAPDTNAQTVVIGNPSDFYSSS